MKERPILFSGEMVRAILEGRKTQTRRVVDERQRVGYPHDEIVSATWTGFTTIGGISFNWFNSYGGSGDRLWVRETWAYNGQSSKNYGPKERRREGYVTYAADGAKVTHYFPDGPMLPSPPQTLPVRGDEEDQFDYEMRKNAYYERYFRRFRPSIHMPRWASRLTLEVTEVRVQRLQDISEEDAKAEGVEANPYYLNDGTLDEAMSISSKSNFEALWQSINGGRPGCSWEENPWVWAISFRRLP